jgi:hypothetical protein
MFPGRKHGQHGGAIAVAGASAEDTFAVLPQDLEVGTPIRTEQAKWMHLPYSTHDAAAG